MNEEELRIGLVGRARLEYIKEHQPTFYAELVRSGELEEYLRQTEREDMEMEARITRQAKQKDPTLSDAQAEMQAREFYDVQRLKLTRPPTGKE